MTQKKKYFLRYRYSLLVDLRNSWQTWRERGWLKEHNLAYTMPSLYATWKLFRKQPMGTPIETDRPITCFWVSSGTWGSYKVPDCIYVCPWYIEQGGGLERVIHHELLHLKHYDDTKGMDHATKEYFIVEKE